MHYLIAHSEECRREAESLSLFTDEETRAWRDEVTRLVSYSWPAECSQSPVLPGRDSYLPGRTGCGWVGRKRLDPVSWPTMQFLESHLRKRCLSSGCDFLAPVPGLGSSPSESESSWWPVPAAGERLRAAPHSGWPGLSPRGTWAVLRGLVGAIWFGTGGHALSATLLTSPPTAVT